MPETHPPPPMLTRGVRRLKEYLEGSEEAKRLSSVHRAAAVAPLLSATLPPHTNFRSEADTASPLPSAVVHYLQARRTCGVSNRLSHAQLHLVRALSECSPTSVRSVQESDTVRVKRVHLRSVSAMVDTIAIAALTRSHTHATTSEGGAVCVIAEDDALATCVRDDLVTRYGLHVLLLQDDHAERFPSWPSSSAATPARKRPRRAVVNTSEPNDALPVCTELVPATVLVATAAGLVSVDRRSAVWRMIGVYVVVLAHAERADSALRRLLSDPNAAAARTRLAAQRWNGLGHCTLACVLALHRDVLTDPGLDWLLTLQPMEPSSGTTTHETTTNAVREPVTLHYAIAEGMERFLMLFALVAGLRPGRGLLVHCASTACCVFVHHALLALSDALPPHVELLADHTDHADAAALCARFDHVVLAGGCDNPHDAVPAAEHTAVVLLSCHGLVPTKGTIFLQYDVVPDLGRLTQFVSDVLTSAAYKPGTAVRRVTQPRRRRRSTSPVPSCTESRGVTPPRDVDVPCASSGTMYRILILLLRPCEQRGALCVLAADAARHALRLAPLPQSPSPLQYAPIVARVRSLHKKTFAFQRLAYEAYKATMLLYAVLKPKSVYDCARVDAQKVAEEFGYVNTTPLLDLRLRETRFRPKEDYYTAARQKQSHERHAYSVFAQQHIPPEPTEEHVVDETRAVRPQTKRRRKRRY